MAIASKAVLLKRGIILEPTKEQRKWKRWWWQTIEGREVWCKKKKVPYQFTNERLLHFNTVTLEE